jgi:hypothetical protein
MDLWAEAQQQFPGDSNPPALKVPMPIQAGAFKTGETIKVCATELDTGKADCGTTTKESPEVTARLGNLFGGPHLISLSLPPR